MTSKKDEHKVTGKKKDQGVVRKSLKFAGSWLIRIIGIILIGGK